MARRYQPMAPFHLSNLPVTLEAAGHIWRNYADARSSYFDYIVGLVKHPWSVPAANFDTDAKAGKLPAVSWLFTPDGLSEHPGDFNHTGKPMVSLGMQWTADRVHAAATGPLWAKTAIFITWDDWAAGTTMLCRRWHRRGQEEATRAIRTRSSAMGRACLAWSSARMRGAASTTPSIRMRASSDRKSVV